MIGLVSRLGFYISNQYYAFISAGEIAPAILATVNVSGSLVDFYIVHFGNDGYSN